MTDETLTLAMAILAEQGISPDHETLSAAVAHVGETQPPAPTTVKMADAMPTAGSVTAPMAGPPASPEVALAGRDGKALARLIRTAKARGVAVMNDVVRTAVRKFSGHGKVLGPGDEHRIAEALAAVNSTAELSGRARVRELADRSNSLGELARFADDPEPLAAIDASALSTPEEAMSYFGSLYPTLGIDPRRYAGEQRRRAFTLAQSCNATLTARIAALIASALRRNVGVADAAAQIADALDASGATSANPQYAEMVFRTNAMDSFQTGMYEEGRSPDVRDVFPCWMYIGIDDHRAGADHRPNFDKLYPSRATFADVRGPRPFNCRCSMRWVDHHERDQLLTAGRHVETHW